MTVPLVDRGSRLLGRAAQHAQQYLDSIHDRQVGALASGDDLRRLLRCPLSEEGEESSKVLDDLARAGQTGTTASQGPRYFGFVNGGSLPIATAADWLVSAWDQVDHRRGHRPLGGRHSSSRRPDEPAWLTPSTHRTLYRCKLYLHTLY